MATAKSEVMNSVDVLIDINNQYTLLVKRDADPFRGEWAILGGRQAPFETLTTAVSRVIKERIGIDVKVEKIGITTKLKLPQLNKEATLHQIRTYDSGKDPRGGNTTVFAVQLHVDKEALMRIAKAGDKVSEVSLFNKSKLPKLAFDHAKFIDDYYKFLKPCPKSESEYDPHAYEKPAVTVDVIIFTIRQGVLQALLIKRKAWPFKDSWALPGGFVEMDESLDEAASRELEEESGVKNVYLEQLYTFGAPKRDPRTRVLSVAYFALVSADKIKLSASSDASDAQWFSVESLPKLAFDHREIIEYALSRVRGKVEYTNIAFQLLPDKFTLSELQSIYEVILGKNLDKRNFRKKIHELGTVKQLKEQRMSGAHRPAQLYSFKNR